METLIQEYVSSPWTVLITTLLILFQNAVYYNALLPNLHMPELAHKNVNKIVVQTSLQIIPPTLAK